MIGAALHIRDEVTEVTTRFWWQDGDTQDLRTELTPSVEHIDFDDITVSHPSPAAQLSCNTSNTLVRDVPRLTRAQALYAVLWQGVDARELRGWL